MTMTSTKRPRVVIVGAGFGGLSAARALARSSADVLIIDRNNYHTFNALLYQVAAAELEPEQISYPVRSIIRRIANVHFMMAEVKAVDLASRAVRTTNNVIPYDFLVLATGSISQFFGVAGAAESTFELKTLDDAIALRNQILCCLEQAVGEPDSELRRRLLTFVIVGGGPTGVEFAGALSELMRGPIAKDYPMLNSDDISVVLLQAMDALLSEFPKSLQNYALRQLSKMGVDVRLSTAVSRVTSGSAYLEDGSVMPTETVVWTAGVRGDPLAGACGLSTTGDGRVRVLPTLQVSGHPEVYVVGDLAYVEKNGRPLPFVAPVAIQQGAAVGRNIKRQLARQAPVPFQYRSKGSMATIGRMAAVVHIGRHQFTGFAAWVLWLVIHIFRLIGFRNRLLVMVNWAWDFLFYERAVRLILPSETCSALQEGSSRGERDWPEQ